MGHLKKRFIGGMMSQIRNTWFYLSIILILSVKILSAQVAKESIFGDVEKLINEAREQGGEWLSPEFFANAVENFKTANEYYINNESTRDIREKLTEARKYCDRVFEVINLGKITLKEPITAREAAFSVKAPEYATELFKEAESRFEDAAREIEAGDIEDARDVGSEAEELFRRAELKSIKDKMLGDSRRLISEAQEMDAEDVAPQTYNYAVNLLNEVEELLVQNRYAKDDARQKAIESVYQANHAKYLTSKIKELRDNDKNWEKLILQFEDILTGIAAQFDEKVKFDQGMKESISTIMNRISTLKENNKKLMAENSLLQEELSLVKEEATTSSAELARKEQREEKIARIKSFFSPSEANVIFDGQDVIISLYGLNFQPGKSIIEPEYFSLLTKVQNSIKEFPSNHILLEGHTDSKGVPQINKRLSEERAKAVREYIIANMGINREQITAVGYGDTKPVASNKTIEGRALNRRIDVVINVVE